MQRKVIKVGTSAAVLIPKAVMDERNLKVGDMIDLDFSGKSSSSVVDPVLIEWTDEFIKKNRGLLDKLVNA
jgi:antitoxin component of MazEF toxin-antitoxin module